MVKLLRAVVRGAARLHAAGPARAEDPAEVMDGLLEWPSGGTSHWPPCWPSAGGGGEGEACAVPPCGRSCGAAARARRVIELYSYPELFGLADNNPFGLKVWAFLAHRRPVHHRHIFDASTAPRRCPTSSTASTASATATRSSPTSSPPRPRHRRRAPPTQRDLDHLIRRTLDDLYWVMSYSRWQDERFWPLFRLALLAPTRAAHPRTLDGARAYNAKRYHYRALGAISPTRSPAA